MNNYAIIFFMRPAHTYMQVTDHRNYHNRPQSIRYYKESNLGTIVNTLGIIVGSLIGLLFKKRIHDNVSESLHKVMGFCVFIVGLFGIMSTMITVTDGKIGSEGTLLLIISIAVGTALGELFKIEERLNRWGEKLEKRFKISNFAQGFISATMLYCVGAMVIIGSLNDGLRHDPSVLYLKAAIDGIVSIFLSASLGAGVLFSAVMVFLVQGLLTLGAASVAPFITQVLIDNVCMVGYGIVLLIGTNMMGATKIKTTNMLPSLIVAAVWTLVGLGRI